MTAKPKAPTAATPTLLAEPTVVLDGVSVEFESTVLKPPPGTPKWNAALHKATSWPYRQKIVALQDITMVARGGDSVALIGANGAGKSTLLRAIAGVQKPTRGVVLARSQPRLQSVGAALVPQLSGWQNIRLGLAALGFDGAESAKLSDEIANLTGLEAALERPMRTYSSGMRARLIFSINAYSKAEILLIDEALATGDATFLSRAKGAMERLREGAGTVFLVTHTLRSARSMCQRAIWMHHGRQVADGPSRAVADRYAKWAKLVTEGNEDAAKSMLAEASADFPVLQSVRYVGEMS